MNEQELRGILSKNINRCRKQSNLTQMALADKLNLSANFISDIERGISWVSPSTLVNLAAAPNVDPYEFFKTDALLSERENDILKSYSDENMKAVLSVITQLEQR
jgi:transcriptional regulator with XRE-family HTH domain